VKNFTKLLMAVVLLATYSCVQDSTEDLAPVISAPSQDSGEVKALQIALPTPSRTELGDKGLDGKYPVYWCADAGKEDVLSVNGEPTTGIELVNPDADGRSSVAIFDMPLQSTIPYSIVYPYNADVEVDTTTGMYPVKFLSEQEHTEGSFASQSAPMYAWSDGFSDVQMHHLSTVLRFLVKAPAGETVDLRYVSVSTVEAEPIAGVFDVYCGSNDENDPQEAGKLVARESATSIVFYTFENNSFTLTDQVQAFYVVVPKGEYSQFEVNFVDKDGNVCVRTFNASGADANGNSLELLPGKVREFPEIEFAANSEMMLIGTDEDMLGFANAVKAGTFNKDGAILVADIDMTDKGLETIVGYESVFEGRNYTIKGLTQPLFGENTVATISNLNVEGNIVETSNGKTGMIARSLAVKGEKVGKIFNCSAKGTLSYANSTMKVSNKLDLINVGGIVGGVYGANVSLSKSYVNISIDAAGPNAEFNEYKPCIGGVVGYVSNETSVVVENANYGSVAWKDVSGGYIIRPFIGGVAGYVVAGEFADNVNHGDLVVEKSMYDLDWGGVLGSSKVTVARCTNKGDLTIAQSITTANVGGVIGRLEPNADSGVKNSLTECDNYGKLLFDEGFYITTSCNIGGVVSNVERGVESVKGCDNYGQIIYRGDCKYDTKLSGERNASMRLGGVVAICNAELLSECNNMESANIEVAGGVSGVTPTTGDGPWKMSSIAGVVAMRCGKQATLSSAAPIRTEKCSNAGSIHCSYEYLGYPIIATSACIGVFDSDEVEDCHNAESGTFVYESSICMGDEGSTTTKRTQLFVAGLIATLYSDCFHIKNCSNSGSIVYDNATAEDLNVSGILGFAIQADVAIENCSNNGNIIVGENVVCNKLKLGGVAASTTTYMTCSYVGCENTNNIIAKAKVKRMSDTKPGSVYIGGVLGEAKNSNKAGAAPYDISNSGLVSFAGDAPTVYIGGYCGYYEDTNHGVSFSNTGKIEFAYGAGSNIETLYIGGYVGSAILETETGSEASFAVSNNGEVAVSGVAKSVYASGCVGYVSTQSAVTGINNAGKIELWQDEVASINDKYPDNIYVGGVFGLSTGSSSSSVTGCYNAGSVIYKGSARDGAYVGGVVGKASSMPIVACENTGTVVSSGQAGDWPARLAESSDKARRYIPMLLGRNSQPCHDLAIGGVIGETNSNVEGCSNDGAITHTCLPNTLKVDDWGGTASSRFDIGGVVGRVYTESTSQDKIELVALTNKKNGKLTIYGSPEATTTSSSMDYSSSKPQSNDVNDIDRANAVIGYRMNLGGVVGRIFDNIVKSGNATNHVKMYVQGCSNEAAISLPEATRAKNLNVAGVAADILATYTTFTDSSNSGDIKVDKVGFGTSQDTTTSHASYFTNLGGIAALCFDIRYRKNGADSPLQASISFNNCQNSGKLYYGEVGASFFQTAGGILGQLLQYYGPIAWVGNNTAVHYRDIVAEFNNCTNSGDIQYYSEMVSLTYNYSYGGGILGNANNPVSSYAQMLGASDVIIRSCSNSGDIQFDRCNGYISTGTSVAYNAVGGIVGFYSGGHGVPSFDIYTRRARADKKVENGGAYNLLIESCRNAGRVWTYSGAAGGIVGRGQWYVKITGTESNPTLNEGDIVVARSGGNIILRNNYGARVIYAGGIAGLLEEYSANTRYLCEYSDNDAADEGNPMFPLGSHYARVEYAVNKGSVGATNLAGGIVGSYRSLKVAAATIDASIVHKGGIEFCRNEGDIYSLEGATSNVGAIIGGTRTFVMTKYTSTSSLIKDDDNSPHAHYSAINDKVWPQAVYNCEIGGSLLRGATRKLVPDAETYQDCIYGEAWDKSNVSNVKDKKFDGCTLYSTEAPAPEQGNDEPEVRR